MSKKGPKKVQKRYLYKGTFAKVPLQKSKRDLWNLPETNFDDFIKGPKKVRWLTTKHLVGKTDISQYFPRHLRGEQRRGQHRGQSVQIGDLPKPAHRLYESRSWSSSLGVFPESFWLRRIRRSTIDLRPIFPSIMLSSTGGMQLLNGFLSYCQTHEFIQELTYNSLQNQVVSPRSSLDISRK